MDDLQRAIKWLQYVKQLKEANIRSYPHRTQDAEAVEHCKVLLDELRWVPCWYCKGIESHKIKSVKTVTDEFNREHDAFCVPYKHCPNCGRPLPAPPEGSE